jgi:nitrogen-specific signal transduction histidine kinase
VDWQVSPLIDQETLQGWIIFIKDRTDYYRWQGAVKKAERLAITAGLVGSLAHELRNPLSAAKALLQLTRQKDEAHRSGGYIDLVERELDRVTRLLNEFLLLGKPAEKHEKPVQLASLLRELNPLLESEANNYGSALLMDLRSDPSIHADSGQLTQVVMNLIRNAAQAAGERGKIFLSLHERDQNAVLTIKDTGPGINPNIKDKLFSPFFTTKERGTGLGLPVVQAIVHNHSGEIWVENAEEGGAVFQVVLPSYIIGGTRQPDVLMAVKDLMIKYPSEQAMKKVGLNIITTDNLQQAILLLEGCQPQIFLVENCLLEEADNINLLQLNAGNIRVVIIGEPNCSNGFDNAIYLSKPLDYMRLVSQLKLLLRQ